MQSTGFYHWLYPDHAGTIHHFTRPVGFGDIPVTGDELYRKLIIILDMNRIDMEVLRPVRKGLARLKMTFNADPDTMSRQGLHRG